MSLQPGSRIPDPGFRNRLDGPVTFHVPVQTSGFLNMFLLETSQVFSQSLHNVLSSLNAICEFKRTFWSDLIPETSMSETRTQTLLKAGGLSRDAETQGAQDYESRLTTMSRGSQPSHLGSHLVAAALRVRPRGHQHCLLILVYLVIYDSG